PHSSDPLPISGAGLQRLGFEDRIRHRLDAPQRLPAPAQGAIAIDCRAGAPESAALLAALDDAPARTRVEAERAMNRALHGSCHVPVAAFATLEGDRLSLQGLVGDAASGRLVRAEASGPAADRQALGERVAEMLLARGAGEFLPPA